LEVINPSPLPQPLPEAERGVIAAYSTSLSPFPLREGGRGVR